MDLMQAIRDRASVRSYSSRPVPEELVRAVVQAGICAPSANDSRPWQIVVVREEAMRRRLADTHQWARFAAQAPVILVVCGDRQRSDTFWIEDTSAATQNMLLAAHALGLGSCWIAIRGDDEDNERKVRDTLGIPEHMGVLAILPLGYPERPPSARPERNPAPHLHQERW